MSKRRIGILGGISHESTVVYYQQLIAGYYARHHDYYYPEIIIYSLDFQRFTDLEDRGDLVTYVELIVAGIDALAAAGAEVVLMAANSPHAVFDQVVARTTLPMINIAQVTAQAAAQAGAKRLLLLGIKFTMQAGFYARICAEYGIEVVTPVEADQDELNQLIFDELALGRFSDENRARLLAIIAHAAQRQIFDGVILGCTELPLLLQQEHISIRLYDTLALHVQAALDYALAESSVGT